MKCIKYLVKMFLAGIVALVLLCIVACFYSLSPMRVENPEKNTDYVWQDSALWMKMTEGVSFGKVDAKGFNNKSVVEKPDIILLGSSHIEGMNVQQNDHMCTLLNEKFSGKHSVYNMGISGHTFFKVVQYLEKSISLYDSSVKYVVIETSTTNLTKVDVDAALNSKVVITAVNNDGIIAMLQRLPFLRQAYHQLESGMMDMLLPKESESTSSNTSVAVSDEVVIDEQPYNDMFSYLKNLEDKYDVEIIIMYHPFEILNKDGSISFGDDEYTEVFAEYSEKFAIGFVDMTDDFEKMYYDEHYVAHGFATGELGVGHINKHGHKAIANSVYNYIKRFEEGV